jgi:hypothetical protein
MYILRSKLNLQTTFQIKSPNYVFASPNSLSNLPLLLRAARYGGLAAGDSDIFCLGTSLPFDVGRGACFRNSACIRDGAGLSLPFDVGDGVKVGDGAEDGRARGGHGAGLGNRLAT